MKKTWDGGPAFPQERTLDCGSLEECEGLSMRDYFAAAALQGLLANPKLEKQIIQQGQSWIEATAWITADAMIKARSEYYD
jgi:hypothetical protein